MSVSVTKTVGGGLVIGAFCDDVCVSKPSSEVKGRGGK